ncbi:hypothetical protein C8R45DRAFT_981588 [Mycena sanguinolenta]|nr:hypothetical protein C8R45DRAFT_981588 [Mycena sanguinolenta]
MNRSRLFLPANSLKGSTLIRGRALAHVQHCHMVALAFLPPSSPSRPLCPLFSAFTSSRLFTEEDRGIWYVLAPLTTFSILTRRYVLPRRMYSAFSAPAAMRGRRLRIHPKYIVSRFIDGSSSRHARPEHIPKAFPSTHPCGTGNDKQRKFHVRQSTYPSVLMCLAELSARVVMIFVAKSIRNPVPSSVERCA